MMFDQENAGMLLHYLARATEKNNTQFRARQCLAENVGRLKREDTEQLAKRIGSLEKKIGHNSKPAIKPKSIWSAESFQDRLAQVEEKIDSYVHAEQGRLQRIHELEEKIRLRCGSKGEREKTLMNLKQALSSTQAKISRAKSINKTKLLQLRERVLQIKEQLKRIEA